ncbi:hypothetical protein [Sphingomonas montanisoli]|uniref:Uncharacterized protein n=1 Tax=Sphingomonas montanisoli TaxID=2606412 RepID=A0A5D9CDA0_9SPHN|nr:hypothetical protein [Sphingomonas montanisoli]TZG29132.1 hypothetical protein FYJ91_03070 [Sphingomonas montanisoli]
MIGLLIAASVASSNPGWAKFSKMAFGMGPTVTIGFFYEKGTKRAVHWFRLQEDVNIQKDKARTLWADVRTCPAARKSIDALAKVSVQLPTPPDTMPRMITIDEGAYTFENWLVFSPGGETLSVSVRRGTPLANWIDSTLTTLKPCWSETAPEQ